MQMTGITNSSFSIFTREILTRQYTITGKRPDTFAKIVVDSIRLADPEKADKLKKKLDDAGQAIVQLRNGKSNMAQERKAAAAQKIQRIKEEIQILMRMGGDPKMIAKQIRKLAQDLAATAREYASAGGKDTGPAAKATPQQAGDHSEDREIAQTSQTLADIEKSFSGMESSGMTTAAIIVVT
jgi:hypothetical protein